MNIKYKLTHRKGRCVQAMIEGTDKWVSTGCYTRKEAILWVENRIRNGLGFIQKPDHKGFRIRKEKERNIRVQFDGSDSWISTGYDDEINATLWAQAKLREMEKQDVTLGKFSEGFYTRTDELSFRARNDRRNRVYSDEYYIAMDGRLRNYILPKFGKIHLRNLDHIEIDEWFVGLKRSTSKATLSSDSKNKVLQCLSNIMKDAVNRGIIDKNPCDKVDSIAEINKQRQALSKEEMEKLFPENDQEAVWVWGGLMWACYFHIMRCTGFRPGEVAGLTKKNYYPELGGVYTTQSVNSYKKDIAKRIKTSDKGKKAKIGLLSAQCCRLLNIYVNTLPKDEKYLFKINGNYVTTSTSNKHFVSFSEKAGISMKGRTQYSLRHTFQTTVAGEIEEKQVEELMGHTKYRQGYDHRDGKRRLEQLQELREKLSNII